MEQTAKRPSTPSRRRRRANGEEEEDDVRRLVLIVSLRPARVVSSSLVVFIFFIFSVGEIRNGAQIGEVGSSSRRNDVISKQKFESFSRPLVAMPARDRSARDVLVFTCVHSCFGSAMKTRYAAFPQQAS